MKKFFFRSFSFNYEKVEGGKIPLRLNSSSPLSSPRHSLASLQAIQFDDNKSTCESCKTLKHLNAIILINNRRRRRCRLIGFFRFHFSAIFFTFLRLHSHADMKWIGNCLMWIVDLFIIVKRRGKSFRDLEFVNRFVINSRTSWVNAFSHISSTHESTWNSVETFWVCHSYKKSILQWKRHMRSFNIHFKLPEGSAYCWRISFH